jgi:hypothetical protein
MSSTAVHIWEPDDLNWFQQPESLQIARRQPAQEIAPSSPLKFDVSRTQALELRSAHNHRNQLIFGDRRVIVENGAELFEVWEGHVRPEVVLLDE